ncbi:MAG: NAD(P)-dependent alcohol dehydrogenase [Chloroflexi bacterium]|nr:NAD(P)-dependent alcohol dehydrogenase [Chloroflexota bacterium]
MRTRAAVLHKFNEPLVVEDIEVGEPRAGEVLVSVVATGICHSDLSAYHGHYFSPLPIILGHEGAGTVEAVGPGVTRVKPGDPVVLSVIWGCGQCGQCLQGRPFRCQMLLSSGAARGAMPDGTKRFRKDGQEICHFFCQSSFAQHTVAPERLAVKVPADVPLEKLGPLGCGVQTGAGAVLNVAKVGLGESVAVFGCGGVGLSAVMAARLARASPIIAIDLVDSRLELARELGATHAVNAAEANPVAKIREITGGGADYAFECIGNVQTIRQAVDCLRMGGAAVITGAPPLGTEVNLSAMTLMTTRILGNLGGEGVPDVFIPSLIDLWRRGEFPYDRMTTKTYGLEQINEAIADMERGTVVKPLIVY